MNQATSRVAMFFAVIVCAAMIPARAELTKKPMPSPEEQKANMEEIRKKIGVPDGMSIVEFSLMRSAGGFVFKPKSGYGKMLFLNSQKRVSEKDLAPVVKEINHQVFITVEISSEKSDAGILVEVVDKEGEPTLAVYPDDKRATVNVAALAKDNPDEAKLAARTRKEMLRAFAFLSGYAGNKSCEDKLMDAMTTMKRLDDATEKLPGDLVMRVPNYLERSGIKPYVRTTYKKACEEGWAHQPSNQWQKAIWDNVYTMPDKPIKIQKKKADK